MIHSTKCSPFGLIFSLTLSLSLSFSLPLSLSFPPSNFENMTVLLEQRNGPAHYQTTDLPAAVSHSLALATPPYLLSLLSHQVLPRATT